MLVIVKSAPDTPEGNRGVQLARDLASDLVFMQNGVYYAQRNRLEAFTGKAYVLDEDSRLRGLKAEKLGEHLDMIDYNSLVDLISNSDKVIGMF